MVEGIDTIARGPRPNTRCRITDSVVGLKARCSSSADGHKNSPIGHTATESTRAYHQGNDDWDPRSGTALVSLLIREVEPDDTCTTSAAAVIGSTHLG